MFTFSKRRIVPSLAALFLGACLPAPSQDQLGGSGGAGGVSTGGGSGGAKSPPGNAGGASGASNVGGTSESNGGAPNAGAAGGVDASLPGNSGGGVYSAGGNGSIPDASVGSPDGAAGAEAAVGPCGVCPSGLCLDGGRCAVCTTDNQCSTGTPRCDLTTHSCVECLSGPTDNCASGQFCDSATLVCKGGCKNDDSCASGSCGVAHDCDRCVADVECADGRVCSTGQCLNTCASTPDCPKGFTCCGSRCADTTRDFQDCGSCGAFCSNEQYCGGAGCTANTVANLCDATKVTLLLDSLPADETAAAEAASTIAAACGASVTTETVSQGASITVNPTSGRPVVGSGDLLVVFGGPAVQQLPLYLDTADAARVRYWTSGTRAGFRGPAADGAVDSVILDADASTFTPSHDFFLIQMVTDPASGTRIFELYGLSAYGTIAASWFFTHRILPKADLATFDLSYYVYEWTDTDADLAPSDGDTFRLVASGN